MSVVFYRIDDRLVHGQVMTGWTKIYKTQRIFVVDDKTAADPFLCQVMQMSMPTDYDVNILTLEDAATAIQNDPPDKRTMVLTKTPDVMLGLIERGIQMAELNVGGMGYLPGRRVVLKNIQITPQEFEVLKQIAAHKVRVYFQIVPDGKLLEIEKVKL